LIPFIVPVGTSPHTSVVRTPFKAMLSAFSVILNPVLAVKIMLPSFVTTEKPVDVFSSFISTTVEFAKPAAKVNPLGVIVAPTTSVPTAA
jgi:hypothetical protein